MDLAEQIAADEAWMARAVQAARDAQGLDEVPVGACVVDAAGALLSVAGNRTRTECDPTAHAEILALRSAAKAAGNYRLTGATVYSTIEPCAMCAGALVHARVARLVYGAPDERFGAVISQFRLCDAEVLNHRIVITAGVLEAECRTLMQQFFRARRQTGKGDG
jgi:tRNA(adenine34) deaminase